MPFVPHQPKDGHDWDKEICTSREHSPPMHIVLRKTMAWRCPKCGKVTIIRPNIARMSV